MSAVGLVTRQQMVRHVPRTTNADVKERVGHDWRRMNASVLYLENFGFPEVTLDFHMFAFNLGGTHRLQTESVLERGDRQVDQVLPGAMTYVQNGVPFAQSGEGMSGVLQIYIDNSVFRETATSIVQGDPDKVELLGFQGVFEPKLRALADAILYEARAPSLGSELQADLLAQQMALVILRRRIGDQLRKPQRRRLSNSELARVIDFLEADLAEGSGMDTLAALIDMDVFTFTRAFKASTGQPPHKFLIERRLARVKDLLINSKDSLADISYNTGFSSQPHMTAAFSKHMKMPPGAYRKRYRS